LIIIIAANVDNYESLVNDNDVIELTCGLQVSLHNHSEQYR